MEFATLLGRRKVGASHKKFSGGERTAEKRMRCLGAGSPPELRQVVCGFALQNLWLRHREVKSEVVGENETP